MAVEFEEERQTTSSGFKSRKILGEPTSPKMVQFFYKTGFVKSEKQAGYLLLAICALCIILSLWLLRGSILAPLLPAKQPTLYYEDIPAADRAKLPNSLLDSLPRRNAQ